MIEAARVLRILRGHFDEQARIAMKAEASPFCQVLQHIDARIARAETMYAIAAACHGAAYDIERQHSDLLAKLADKPAAAKGER